jgi:LacI family transcriptional regulator
MATINDVCKLAGVSKTTVSRVINNSEDVREQTRNKVLTAIKTLGYQPNTLAQAFASNTSNSIGLALPHFDSNYFGCIMRESAQIAQKSHKKLFVMDTHNHMEGEIEAVQTLAKQRCDVIILYSRHLSEPQLIQLQGQIQPKIIVLNRTLLTNHLFSFDFSQEQLGSSAVEHLLQLGHKNIACITTPLEHETGKRRLKAYKNALIQADIEIDEALIKDGHSTLEGGYNAINEIFKSNILFTAVYCCNDVMAFGVMRSLYERNIKIPQQISIVGIDNDPASAFATPSLTSVTIPIERLTLDALDLALKLLNKENIEPRHFEYQGEIMIRESTAL